MRTNVWKIKPIKATGENMLWHIPSGVTIFYNKIEIGQFKRNYELFSGDVMIAILDIKTNRIENYPVKEKEPTSPAPPQPSEKQPEESA